MVPAYAPMFNEVLWMVFRKLRGAPMTQAEAETLAAEALLWLSQEPERLGTLLGASGLAAADLRAGLGEPAFLGFVLDHLLGDEAAVLAFAAETGRSPQAALAARAALPGGDAPHWT